MGERGVPFVTPRAHRKLLGREKVPEVRAVRTMAARAFPLFGQGVFVLVFLVVQIGFGVLVTRQAHFGLFPVFKMGLVRGVRVVAVHAENASPHMAVDLPEVLDHAGMAAKTNGRAFDFQAQRIPGPKAVVACGTLVLGERLVQALLDQAFSFRPVRAVARQAVRALDRIIEMRFFRLRGLNRMAGHAQFFAVLSHQAVIIRGVRGMAFQAITLSGGTVFMLLGKTLLGMTPEAELLIFRNQQIGVLRGVGFVARQALSFLKGLVPVPFGHKPLFVLMAASAQPAHILPEQALVLRGMGIVTIGALELLKGLVDPFPGHLLFHVRVAPQALFEVRLAALGKDLGRC